MALPSEFSEVEHLQATIRRYLNREIREHFNDLGDQYWEPEVTTSRGSMRHALTHKDEDPMQVTVARMMLYYFTYGAAKAMQPDIYGTTIISKDRTQRYKPQISLYFNNKGYNPRSKEELVEGLIRFRLINESSTTLTKTELNNYATKIKNAFASPTKFIWHKGRTMATYTDLERGYKLQILCTGETEAKRVIAQVLDIQQHTPNWRHLNISNNEEATERYPANPGTMTILGKTVQKPKYRPVEDVIFRYATINVHGLGRGINLVDTTFTRSNALQRAA